MTLWGLSLPRAEDKGAVGSYQPQIRLGIRTSDAMLTLDVWTSQGCVAHTLGDRSAGHTSVNCIMGYLDLVHLLVADLPSPHLT